MTDTLESQQPKIIKTSGFAKRNSQEGVQSKPQSPVVHCITKIPPKDPAAFGFTTYDTVFSPIRHTGHRYNDYYKDLKTTFRPSFRKNQTSFDIFKNIKRNPIRHKDKADEEFWRVHQIKNISNYTEEFITRKIEKEPVKQEVAVIPPKKPKVYKIDHFIPPPTSHLQYSLDQLAGKCEKEKEEILEKKRGPPEFWSTYDRFYSDEGQKIHATKSIPLRAAVPFFKNPINYEFTTPSSKDFQFRTPTESQYFKKTLPAITHELKQPTTYMEHIGRLTNKQGKQDKEKRISEDIDFRSTYQRGFGPQQEDKAQLPYFTHADTLKTQKLSQEFGLSTYQANYQKSKHVFLIGQRNPKSMNDLCAEK